MVNQTPYSHPPYVTYHAQNKHNLFLGRKAEATGLQLWMMFLYTVLKTQLTSVSKMQISMS